MLSTMLKGANITLYSIGVPRLARAASVGLLLSDANVPFNEKSIQYKDWMATRKQFQTTAVGSADNTQTTTAAAGVRNPYGAAPTLEINGQWYAQTAPMLRLLARELGKWSFID
jgi:hypothetical protein